MSIILAIFVAGALKGTIGPFPDISSCQTAASEITQLLSSNNLNLDDHPVSSLSFVCQPKKK